MEDVIYYIVLGLIITASLVKKANKNVAQKRKYPDSEPDATPIPEIKSLETLFEELTKRPNTNTPQPVTRSAEMESGNLPSPQYNEAQSLEEIIDEESNILSQTANKPTKRAKVATAPKPSNTGTIAKKTPKTAKTGQNKGYNPQSEIAEEFDLREAVIYSEILKPKFDE